MLRTCRSLPYNCPMSEGPDKARWAQFSIWQLVVRMTWYAIYAGIITGLRLSDRRLYLVLMLAPVIAVPIGGFVVLFAPKQRRWLMPVVIGLICIAGGFVGWWLAMLRNSER